MAPAEIADGAVGPFSWSPRGRPDFTRAGGKSQALHTGRLIFGAEQSLYER